jgi:hypothetical protein
LFTDIQPDGDNTFITKYRAGVPVWNFTTNTNWSQFFFINTQTGSDQEVIEIVTMDFPPANYPVGTVARVDVYVFGNYDRTVYVVRSVG